MYTVQVQTSDAHCVTVATKKSCDKLQHTHAHVHVQTSVGAVCVTIPIK